MRGCLVLTQNERRRGRAAARERSKWLVGQDDGHPVQFSNEREGTASFLFWRVFEFGACCSVLTPAFPKFASLCLDKSAYLQSLVLMSWFYDKF